MDQERIALTGSELARWLILAALIIGGIALFFYLAPSTDSVVQPTVQESVR